MVQTAYLLLGSNLGDRRQLLLETRRRLEPGIGRVVQSSSVYETTPWGNADQPAYLNQVLALETLLTPPELMMATQRLEESLGRVRSAAKWEPRSIDIDILYFGRLVWYTPGIAIPHPLLHQRRFALVPLVEVAPDFRHPELRKTNIDLLEECEDPGKVIKL